MQILHFADVHLDRPFVGLPPDAAKQRRADLMDAFSRCLTAAKERGVDAVTIGGDLWEDENVSPDTRASVAHQLESLDVPVVIVAGNHDPYLKGGAYQRTTWPENVRIVQTPMPVEIQLGRSVSVWAASWTERPLTAAFLRELRLPADGRSHLLLLHGTAQDVRFGTAAAHCSFDPQEAQRAGVAAVLCGHIHAASDIGGVIYPGSLEPLDHTEIGRHCYAVIDVDRESLEVELVDVNRRKYVSATIDCADAQSSAEVETRVREGLGVTHDPDAIVTVRLEGETGPDCSIDSQQLVTRLGHDFAAATIDDATEPCVDYDALARRQTADGLFVAGMLARIEQEADGRQRQVLEMALRAGVRAMNGHKDVLRVG